MKRKNIALTVLIMASPRSSAAQSATTFSLQSFVEASALLEKQSQGRCVECVECDKCKFLARSQTSNCQNSLAGWTKLRRTLFWEAVRVNGSKANIELQVKQRLRKYKQTETISKAKYEYQPLSWYARQGYNADDIKAKCTDTWEHSILGTCYRVEIHAGAEEQREGSRRWDEACPSSAPDANQAAEAPRQEPSSSSSSRSAAAKLEKENLKRQIAELQAKKQQAEKEAQKILGFIVGEISLVEMFLKSKQFKALRNQDHCVSVAEGMVATKAKLDAMKKDCTAAIQNGATLDTSFADARALVSQSGIQRQFIAQLSSVMQS